LCLLSLDGLTVSSPESSESHSGTLGFVGDVRNSVSFSLKLICLGMRVEKVTGVDV
jgi:hypothetical protein